MRATLYPESKRVMPFPKVLSVFIKLCQKYKIQCYCCLKITTTYWCKFLTNLSQSSLNQFIVYRNPRKSLLRICFCLLDNIHFLLQSKWLPLSQIRHFDGAKVAGKSKVRGRYRVTFYSMIDWYVNAETRDGWPIPEKVDRYLCLWFTLDTIIRWFCKLPWGLTWRYKRHGYVILKRGDVISGDVISDV